MPPSPFGSIFAPDYLERMRAEGTDAAEATTEADAVGPWSVEETPAGLWAVTALGDEPEVLAQDYETALLVAAALPTTGGVRLVRMLEDPGPQGYPLISPSNEPVAHSRHYLPGLADALHTLASLHHTPLALARYLHTARATALARAGRIAWRWEQVPPWAAGRDLVPPPAGSVFDVVYLAQVQAEVTDTAEATTEADTVGPWSIEQLPSKLWAVTALGDEPEVHTPELATALLVAAALPTTGRARLVRMLQDPTPQGYPLVSTANELLGRARHFLPQLAEALHVLEAVRRSPLDLARFLHSTSDAALVRAGRILWLWDQAPPRHT